MAIIICFFIGFFSACIITSIYEVVSNKVRTIRLNKLYANLPKKVLLIDVWNNPVYNEKYYNLRQIMSDDRASTIAVKRMLSDRKILKYRKEEL